MGVHHDLLLEAVLERLGARQRSASPSGRGSTPPQSVDAHSTYTLLWTAAVLGATRSEEGSAPFSGRGGTPPQPVGTQITGTLEWTAAFLWSNTIRRGVGLLQWSWRCTSKAPCCTHHIHARMKSSYFGQRNGQKRGLAPLVVVAVHLPSLLVHIRSHAR